jgi:hypothetical protein
MKRAFAASNISVRYDESGLTGKDLYIAKRKNCGERTSFLTELEKQVDAASLNHKIHRMPNCLLL